MQISRSRLFGSLVISFFGRSFLSSLFGRGLLGGSFLHGLFGGFFSSGFFHSRFFARTAFSIAAAFLVGFFAFLLGCRSRFFAFLFGGAAANHEDRHDCGENETQKHFHFFLLSRLQSARFKFKFQDAVGILKGRFNTWAAGLSYSVWPDPFWAASEPVSHDAAGVPVCEAPVSHDAAEAEPVCAAPEAAEADCGGDDGTL